MSSSLVVDRQGRRLIGLLSLVMVAIAASSAKATDFTLSDSLLMQFDTVYKAEHAQLLRKTDVPGAGVEFEIQLTSNQFSFFYGIPLTSGVLSRADYDQFEHFNLKFTYLDVVGDFPDVRSAGLVGAGCSFNGAYVNPWIAPVTRPTNTASLRTSAMGGRETWIGLDVTSWSTTYHNPAGAIVTLLVEADPTAVTIPEPACVLLLTLGGLTQMKPGRRTAVSGPVGCK
jgi:hypothetical protein